ncbi:MAG: DegT/DnrJ/EryC1/StrS family aminotransferase [Candidatus Curtissbacteria bacterium]|nr:DegT/DnrJ/EryC1/StrS family aminotransferase [Candidatus Curtissbacteria bacterium]
MIPLVDLSTDKKLTAKIKATVCDVIDSKNYILGERLKSFEKKFTGFIGAEDAVGVGSGTDALRLCLRALGVGAGDMVLTVGFTSPFTAIAILEEGAMPVFCDIDPETWTLDVKSIEGKLDSHIKAIMPVHIYGNPCNMDVILEFAKKNNLVVIEDACQAVGASIGSKMTGTFGDAAAFSFYPTKNLGGMGDGGMVTTASGETAEMIRVLRHGGQTKRFWHEYAGINSRLDEMQAAILEEKLAYLKEDNRKRAGLAGKYVRELGNLPLKFQEVLTGAFSCWHQFVVLTPLRDRLKEFLLKKDITTDIYYPYAVYSQKAFMEFPKFKTPVTDKLSGQVLSIPLYPSLSDGDCDYIIKSIKEFFKTV